jgi:hypothetical protein
MGTPSTKPDSILSKANLSLILLGILALVSYFIGIRSQDGEGAAFPYCLFAQSLIVFVGLALVIRARTNHWTLNIIIVFAILFRLSVVFSAPELSTDVYRYVWDGRVQGAGINPYRYVPKAPELAHLRDDDVYPNINRADYARTIYPPVAQMVFLAATRFSDSVIWMKGFITLFDVASFWLILKLISFAGLRRERLIAYAWHPVIIWEFAGNGHVDAVMIFFLALALVSRYQKRDTLTGVFLGLATLTKLYPVLLFPALQRRWNYRMPLALLGTVVVGYLPYVSAGRHVLGFLPGYAKEEGLVNGSRFFVLDLVRTLPGMSEAPVNAFIVLALGILIALAIWALLRKEKNPHDFLVPAFAIALAFTILLSPHYAWYFSWLIPFICFVPFYPFLLFSGAVSFLDITSVGNFWFYLFFLILSTMFLVIRKMRLDLKLKSLLAKRMNRSDLNSA